jgi:uncharacterized protein DUF6893
MKEMSPMKIAMWVVVALFALVMAREMPELRRYLKIKSM